LVIVKISRELPDGSRVNESDIRLAVSAESRFQLTPCTRYFYTAYIVIGNTQQIFNPATPESLTGVLGGTCGEELEVLI
jgi:hypothetical protein